MKTIRFSQNWNNKLNNTKAFTTIRLRNNSYKLGNVCNVELNGKSLGTAIVIKLIPCPIHQLPELLCFLDTGYNLQETQGIIKKIYRGINWDKEQLVILLMKWTNKE